MSLRHPSLCRRALRDIAEIAAVAARDDSVMTDQEALATIAAIAEWVLEETPREPEACKGLVQRINGLTSSIDVSALDDLAAQALFQQIEDLVLASPGQVAPAQLTGSAPEGAGTIGG